MTTLREHLLERGCRTECYSIALDEEDQVATFYLYNLTGQMVGYQQYRPGKEKNVSKARQLYGKNIDLRQLRYYTHCPDKTQCFFGLEQYASYLGPMFVVEGIFDCIKIHNLGLNAVAVFGNAPQYIGNLRRSLGCKTIAICDNDEGGKELAKYTNHHVFCPPGKDPGDMTEDELRELINNVLGQ